MKVLLINGSPHEHGATHAALQECARTLAECGVDTEILWLGTAPISGCLGCGGCRRRGRCVIDDVVNAAIDKAAGADGFIFGTPVHYGSASGALTSFMDRLFFSGAGTGNFYLKPATAIAVARRGGLTATWDQLNKYFGLSNMPIVTSQYWNMAHSGRDLCDSDPEGLQTMRTLARNMAYLLECQKVAREHGVQLPKREITVFTNFVR